MTAPVRYIVRRQEYTPPVAGVRRVLPEKWSAVATFPKRADADAECVKLLADFRRTQNPFQLGGPNLFYQTSLPPYALHDYLLDHDITPPTTAATSNPNYVFWWVKNNRTFTDEQRAVVWQACDKLRPFAVAEEDDRCAVWLVVEVPWGNTDGLQWATSVEGGDVHSAWRIIRDAKRAMRDAEPDMRDFFDDTEEFHVHRREGYETSDPWLTHTQIPVAEVRRLTCAGDVTGSRVSVIVRQGYSTPGGGYETDCEAGRYNWGVRVPLAATTDPTKATNLLRERIDHARRTVNPFALVWCDRIYTDWDSGMPPNVLLTELELDDGLLPNDTPASDVFDLVRRLDTTPPPPESNDLLADWYDQVVRWSPEFIDVIWGTFADFRLFEVIEVPLG